LALAGNGGTPLLEITLAGAVLTSDGLRKLHSILASHPGGSPIRLHLELPEGGQVTIAPASSLGVNPAEPLRQAIEAAFGAGCVSIQ
jgi:hypothetical protein